MSVARLSADFDLQPDFFRFFPLARLAVSLTLDLRRALAVGEIPGTHPPKGLPATREGKPGFFSSYSATPLGAISRVDS